MNKKTLAMLAATLFVAMIVMITGCERSDSSKGDAPSPATKAAGTTVPAGSLGGISFKVDGKHYSTADYFATYFPSENSTGFIGGTDGEGGWHLEFSIEGKGTGTFTASADMRFGIFSGFSTEDLNVTITSYGDIREYIEGTFSGALTSHSDPDKTITITDGKFAAWRTPF